MQEGPSLLQGILTFVCLTGLAAIPWILIGRIIGNREEVISPLLRYRPPEKPSSIRSEAESDEDGQMV